MPAGASRYRCQLARPDIDTHARLRAYVQTLLPGGAWGYIWMLVPGGTSGYVEMLVPGGDSGYIEMLVPGGSAGKQKDAKYNGVSKAEKGACNEVPFSFTYLFIYAFV